MSKLIRIKAGDFSIDSAHKLEELGEKFLEPVEKALMRFEKLELNADESRLYRNGVPIKTEVQNGRYRVYLDGVFYGICLVESGIIKSEKKICSV